MILRLKVRDCAILAQFCAILRKFFF